MWSSLRGFEDFLRYKLAHRLDSGDLPGQLQTLKYQPTFPKIFGCIADAKAFCHTFFD